MKRKAMLAAALGLLLVGCQSEFDSCMKAGTAVWLDQGNSEKDARFQAFVMCVPNKEG